MDEVAGILIALTALVLGLLALGWAYGDFNPPPAASKPGSTNTPAGSA